MLVPCISMKKGKTTKNNVLAAKKMDFNTKKKKKKKLVEFLLNYLKNKSLQFLKKFLVNCINLCDSLKNGPKQPFSVQKQRFGTREAVRH